MASTSQQSSPSPQKNYLTVEKLEDDVKAAFIHAEVNSDEDFVPDAFMKALFESCKTTKEDQWKFFLDGQEGEEFREEIRKHYETRGGFDNGKLTVFQVVKKCEDVRKVYSSMLVKLFDARMFQKQAFITNVEREKCLGEEIMTDYRSFKTSCGKHWNYRIFLTGEDKVPYFSNCVQASDDEFAGFWEEISDGEFSMNLDDDEKPLTDEENKTNIEQESQAEEEVEKRQQALLAAQARLAEMKEKTRISEQRKAEEKKQKEFAITLVEFNKKSKSKEVENTFKAVHEFYVEYHQRPNFKDAIETACVEMQNRSHKSFTSGQSVLNMPGCSSAKLNVEHAVRFEQASVPLCRDTNEGLDVDEEIAEGVDHTDIPESTGSSESADEDEALLALM